MRELPTIALARVKRGVEHCAEFRPGPANDCGACAILIARRKVNAQHAGTFRSESLQMLRPLNQGHAALLSLINYSRT
jgi:hypothetical protein